MDIVGVAGGHHACAVAEALGMRRVLIHPLAGVLSAYGMGLADVSATRSHAVEEPLTDSAVDRLDPLVAELGSAARSDLDTDPDHTEVQAHLRYAGTDTALQVPLGSAEEMTAASEAAYRQRVSVLMPGTGNLPA